MFKRGPVGGTWIRKPNSDTCVFFIHGILSDGEQAWMNGAGTTWPRLLEADRSLDAVGIYSFSFRTDLFSRNYSIGDIVDSIREAFNVDELWKLRQIVFVCHSMGGIAVRRFICVHQAKFIERKSDLGLFLVASPSLGSKDANALHIFARLLRSTQAEALRFCQTNTWLNDLDKEFLTLKEDKRVSISGKELVEDEPIPVKKYLGLWTQLVEPFSAARYFGEPYKVPYSNHNSIAKPADEEAIQHKLLVRFIKSMMYEQGGSRPVDPIKPEGPDEARRALLTLNERLNAGKIKDKAALAAFSLAIIETRRYIADRNRGAERDGAIEARLSGLWNDAGHAVFERDRELAQLCWIKSNGWIDERVWDDPRFKDLPIELNDMLEKLRDVGGQSAVDIVEGECAVSTTGGDWSTRVPLPPFKSPPGNHRLAQSRLVCRPTY